MNATCLCRIVVFLVLGAVLGGPVACAQTAQSTSHPVAAAAWHKEFDDVCSRTEQAMSFSTEQLTRLIERCDALQLKIDRLDETQRKVFSGRLHQCRGLYAYVLESKQNESKQNESKQNESKQNEAKQNEKQPQDGKK